MGITEALAVLAKVGTDETPTAAELASARDTIARTLHASKGSGDLESLVTLRDAYQAADAAVKEAEAAEAETASEADEVLEGIPNPDAELEADTEDGETTEEPKRALSAAEAVARLGLVVTDREPEPEAPKSSQTLTLDGEVKNDATWQDIGKAFSNSTRRTKKAGRNSLLQVDTVFAEKLPGRIDENTRLLDAFTSPEAVTAAGGCCSLAQPIYDNPVNSSLERPIRDALPSFGATRGAVSFYPAVCLPDSGAALWTCDDDLAVDPDDEDTWKQCFDVECEEEDRAQVEAIYSCLSIGNFQQRFSPEQWTAHLRAVSALQSRVAEVSLFEKMRAGVTTTHTVEDTGSIYVTLLNTVGRASAAIRQDQRLADVQLDFFAPFWLLKAIRSDLRARRLAGVDNPDVTDALIASAFANEGVRPVWSLDLDPLEPGGQVDGPLSNFLDEAHTVLAPNGYFTYLDGGTLDLGTEIRDMDSNRQNKVSAFAESFEGLLARGCNAKAIDIPVTVCDDAFCVSGS